MKEPIGQYLKRVKRSFKRRARGEFELLRVNLQSKMMPAKEVSRLRMENGALRLHIGCGRKRLKGYVNVDKFDTPGADLRAPAELLPFPNDSVDEILTSHMIEHLPPRTFEVALGEWWRALKPGAKLTIRCPNFEVYAREWLEGDDGKKAGWGLINLFGHQDRGTGLLNRNAFTVERLERLLAEAGYEKEICEITATRPEYDGTEEFRENGDIIYVGRKVSLPKVLYVDAMTQMDAEMNTQGMLKAYKRAARVWSFDYRHLSAIFGQSVMNRLLQARAKRIRPHLVHLGKAETVSGETVRQIKKETGARVIHFYGDLRLEPQPWVIDIGREADLTLLYHRDEELIAKHRRAGVRHIGHWLVGTDPERFYPREVEQEYEVVFMGNNSAGGSTNVSGSDYRGRQELIEGLAEEGIDLHLFGTGWEYLGERPNVSLHPFVGGDDFARACSAAKITLGHSTNRAYLYNSWRRPFNSMACGAFHLTRYVPGMETLFDNGIHLVWFESVSEAIARARYYLDHDAERAKIAEAGRELVLGNHTWEHRISEMMKYAKLCTNDTNGKSERSAG